MQKFLVIQTAFIGDVVLATGIIEKLHQYYPHAQIDFLVRKGNEALLDQHPFLHQVLIWDKKKNKYHFLEGTHEIERNHSLISEFTDPVAAKPKLYPTISDAEKVKQYKGKA